MLKSSLVFDEFSSIFVNGIDSHIAVARGYRSAITLGLQDLSQLRKDYGHDQAEVIMNIVGNVISGQVSGDTAKQLTNLMTSYIRTRHTSSAFEMTVVDALQKKAALVKENTILCNGFKTAAYIQAIINMLQDGFKNIIQVLDNRKEFNDP